MTSHLPDDAITAAAVATGKVHDKWFHYSEPINLDCARAALAAALPVLTAAITLPGDAAVTAAAEAITRVITSVFRDDPERWQVRMLAVAAVTAVLPALTGAITAQAEDEEPVYEAGHSQVDWERLNRLRAAGAVESDDLADWYAEQNMLEPHVQHAAIAAQAAAAERERWRQPVRDLFSLLDEVSNYGFSHDNHPNVDWDRFGVRQDELERKFVPLLADLLGGTADGAHTPGGAT